MGILILVLLRVHRVSGTTKRRYAPLREDVLRVSERLYTDTLMLCVPSHVRLSVCRYLIPVHFCLILTLSFRVFLDQV